MQQTVSVHPVADRVRFNGFELELVRHADALWLRADQLGQALGYRRPRAAMQRLWQANATEIGAETDLVRMKTLEGVESVRIFSPMGARLLALLSRAPQARAVRAWLASAFEGQALSQERLSPAQQREIQRRVAERVRQLFGGNRGQGFGQVYSGIKDAFAVGSYKMVPSSQFDNLVAFIDEFVPQPQEAAGTTPIAAGGDEFERYVRILRRQGADTRDLETFYASGHRIMQTALDLLRHRLEDTKSEQFLF